MRIGMLLVNRNKLCPEAQAHNGHIDWFFAHIFLFAICCLLFAFLPLIVARFPFDLIPIPVPRERILSFGKVSPDAYRGLQFLISRCKALYRYPPLVADGR